MCPTLLASSSTESSRSEALPPLFDDLLPDALTRQQAEDETRHVSLATQNALYRSILSSYAKGLSDQGALATFALEYPDEATRALEVYQAQVTRVVEMTQEFLLSSSCDPSGLEREMDRLLRMRGAGSRAATGVVDARGSRRRKR